MKRKMLLAVISLSAIIPVKAQLTDTAQLMVHYKFTHLRDTTNRDHPYTENMVLLTGAHAGVYRSYDRQLQDAMFRKQLAEQQAASPDGNVQINRQSNASGTEYYQFPNEGKLFVKERLFNSYLIECPMPAINWKVTNDTMTLGGLHCQQATADFKGRSYTAWFCADLPIHAGPWKLNGLPGVIVEAYDAKREVVFKFDGLEKVLPSTPVAKATKEPGIQLIGMDDLNADPAVIELPKSAIKTTAGEFEKLKEAVRKDPDAFAQSVMASQAPNMQDNGPKPIVKIRMGPAIVINNPIELPDKK